MDRVRIEQLEVETTIGIYEWERRIRQRVVFDLELATDVARAAASDRIEDALDYKAVAKRVRAVVESARFGLVESLAEAVAKLLRDEFAARWVRVAVRKPAAVSGAAAVGVVIERGERDA
ncbi:MAG TPA: dihydroneopterin aldolase [Gammaproteobacteria bacterium]|nr:dihydroneopterin aldolase [Gammaproteobacteria bacterium]